MKNVRRRDIIKELIRKQELTIENHKKIILRYRKDLVSPVIMEYKIS